MQAKARHMLVHWGLPSWNPEPTMLEEAQPKRPSGARIPATPAAPRHWPTQQTAATSHRAQVRPAEVPGQSKGSLRRKLFQATKCFRVVCYVTTGGETAGCLPMTHWESCATTAVIPGELGILKPKSLCPWVSLEGLGTLTPPSILGFM